MSDTYHFPPELLDLLCDTIPRLTRTKRGVVDFFRGAGVSPNFTNDLVSKLNNDRDSISKYEIARSVLVRLNEGGDQTLRERREILKRVTEFENFSACWAGDQLIAKGLVAEVRQIVNVKDSFSRINQEREREHQARIKKKAAAQREENKRKEKLTSVKADFFALFNESNVQSRGKALEGVLNSLFALDGILVKEAFTIKGDQGEGILEQIDGVVEVDGHVYLVEMKWWEKPLGRKEVSQHLVNLYSREQARGIFISNSGYTGPAEADFRDALKYKVAIMCKLEEFVFLLEKEIDLKKFLKAKINAAIADKNPFHEPLKHEFANS